MGRDNKTNLFNMYKNSKKKTMTKDAVTKSLEEQGISADNIAKYGDAFWGSQFLFDTKQLKDFEVDLGSSLTIAKGSGFHVKKPKEVSQIGVGNALKSLTPLVNDINNHTKKIQTGSQLIDNAVDISLRLSNNPSRLSTSLASVIDSGLKFQASKSFLSLDTETFGGKNKFGFQSLLGMQEFSLTEFNRTAGGGFTQGKKIEGLFGLDSTNKFDMAKINQIYEWIDSYETTGQLPGTGVAEVTLRRLAVEGHSNTVLNYGDNGLVTVKSYASPEDMKGKKLDINLIKEGLRKELSIGDWQRSHGRINIGGNETISATDVEFYKYINMLNSNMALSKNGIAFDKGVLQQELYRRSQSLTPNQARYLEQQFGKGFNKLTFGAGHMDEENIIKLATEKFGVEKYIPTDRLKYIESRGLTPRSLEGMTRALYEEVYTGSAAHTAGVDTFAGATLAAGKYQDGKSLIDVMLSDIMGEYGDGLSVKMNNNMITTPSGEKLTPIFMAKQSDSYFGSPVDFVFDEVTGDIHFGNKTIVRADGTLGEAVNAPGIKTSALYEIQVNRVKPTKEIQEKLTQAGIEQLEGADEWFVASYIPQVDPNVAKGNENLIMPIHRIYRDIDSLQAGISNTTIYAMNKDVNGAYRELNTKDGVTKRAIDEAKELLAVYTTDENGKRIIKQTTADEKIAKGTYEMINDSAARELRDQNFKKVMKFKDVQKYYNNIGYKTNKSIHDRIGYLVSKQVAGGKSLSLSRQEQMELDKLVSLIGYKDIRTGNNVIHPGTLKNFYNTFDTYSALENAGILNRAIKMADGKAMDAGAQYSTIMDALRDEFSTAVQEDNVLRDDFFRFMKARGKEDVAHTILGGGRASETYGFQNNKVTFELPASFFPYYADHAADPEDLLTIDLAPGKQYSFMNNMMNKYYGPDAVKRMTPAEKSLKQKHLMTNLAKELNKTEGSAGIFDDLFNGKGYADNKQELLRLKELQRQKKINLPKDIAASIDEAISNSGEIDMLRGELSVARSNAIVNRKDYLKAYKDTLDKQTAQLIDEDDQVKALRRQLSSIRKQINEAKMGIDDGYYTKKELFFEKKKIAKEFPSTIYWKQKEWKEITNALPAGERPPRPDKFWEELSISEQNAIKDYHSDVRSFHASYGQMMEEAELSIIAKEQSMNLLLEQEEEIYSQLDDRLGAIAKDHKGQSFKDFRQSKRDIAQSKYDELSDKLDEMTKIAKGDVLEEFENYMGANKEEYAEILAKVKAAKGTGSINDMSGVSIAQEMQRILRNQKALNPSLGVVVPKTVQNLTDDKDFIEYIGNSILGKNLVNQGFDTAKGLLMGKRVIDVTPESLELTAKEITDTVLNNVTINGKKVSNVTKIANHAAEIYKYDSRTVEINVKLAKRAQEEWVKNTMNQVYSAGGQVIYNKNRMQIQFGDVIEDITNYMPNFHFSNGSGYFQFGGNSVASGIMFDATEGIRGTGASQTYTPGDYFRSVINPGVQKTKNAFIDPKDSNTAKAKKIRSMLSSAVTESKNNAQISGGNTVNEARDSMSRLKMSKAIYGLAGMEREVFGPGSPFTRQEQAVLRRNWGAIVRGDEMPSDIDQLSTAIEKRMLSLLTGNTLNSIDPKSDAGYIINTYALTKRDTDFLKYERRFGMTDMMAYQQIGNYRKPPMYQGGNAKIFRKDDIQKVIDRYKDTDDVFKSFTPMKTLATEMEAALTSRTMDGITPTTDTFTGRRLIMSDMDYKSHLKAEKMKDLANAKTPEEIKRIEDLYEMAAGHNILEQQKIHNSRIAEITMIDNDTQYFNANSGIMNTLTNKKYDVKNANKLMERQARVMPVIKVDKNGRITVSNINAKVTVNKFESLFVKDEFGGLGAVGANFDGMFGSGFFYKNTNIKLTQQELEDFLNNQNVSSADDAYKAAKEAFDFKFFVQNAVTREANKGQLEHEKGVFRSTAVATGKLDKRLAGLLEGLGKGDKVNSFVKEEYLRLKMAEEGFTDPAILKKYGFSSVDEVIAAHNAERHSVQDLLTQKFGAFMSMSNDSLEKHENLDSVTLDLLNTAALKKMETRGLTREEAFKEVYDTIKDSEAFGKFTKYYDPETGQIIKQSVKPGTVMTHDSVLEIAKKLDMVDEDGKTILFGMKNTIGPGQVTYTSGVMAGPSEYAGVTQTQGVLKNIDDKIKALKDIKNPTEQQLANLADLEQTKMIAKKKNKLLTIDERASINLERQSYNVSNKLNVMHSDMSKIHLDNGKTLWEDLYGEMTTIGPDGKVTLKEGVDHRVNAALLDDLKAKSRFNEDLEYLGGEFKRLDESYLKGLAPGDERRAIFNRFYDPNKPISVGKAETYHSLDQSRKALMFNAKKISEADLLDQGFTNIDIDDFIRIGGPGSVDFIGEDGVGVGKSFLLNIPDKNGNAMKVAVPYTALKQSGDEAITDGVGKGVNKLVGAYERMKQFQSGTDPDMPYDIEHYQNNVIKAMKELRHSITTSAQKVEKNALSTTLGEYNYSKATGIKYYTQEEMMNSKFFSTAKFRGKTLKELADEGVRLPFGIAGESYFENAGYFKKEYMDSLGITNREDMVEYLQEHGVAVIGGRNPLTEDTSLMQMRMYLNADRNNTDIIMSMESHLIENGDFDGDTSFFHFLNAKRHNQKLELAADQAMGAYSINLKAYHENAMKGKITKEAGYAKATWTSVFNKSASGSNKQMISMIDFNLPQETINDYMNITDNLMNSIEGYDSLNFDDALDALTSKAENMYAAGTKEREDAFTAIYYRMALGKQSIANMSNSSKKDIGYMDTPMTELERMGNAMKLSADEQKGMAALTKAVRETPISAKHSASAELSATMKVRRAWKGAMAGNENDAQEFMNFVKSKQKDVLERISQSDGAYAKGVSESDDEFFERLVLNPTRRILDAGQTVDGQRLHKSIAKMNELTAEAHSLMSDRSIFGEVVADALDLDYVPKSTMNNLASKGGNFMDGFENAPKKLITSASASSAASMAGGIINGMTGGGLAMTAIGLAAGIMAAGYIGGNPTVAPGTEAEDLESYESLQDEDLSIQALPQGQQGYVININAQGAKGKEHVQQAIQQAVQNSMTTDVNISMSLQDNTKTINSRYIEKLLTSVI